MDAGVMVLVLGLSLVGCAAGGAFAVWWEYVRPLRAQLRAECARLDRLAASASTEVLASNLARWRAESDAQWALDSVGRLMGTAGRLMLERDEALRSLSVALEHYGRQAARADAAEQAEVDRALRPVASTGVVGPHFTGPAPSGAMDPEARRRIADATMRAVVGRYPA